MYYDITRILKYLNRNIISFKILRLDYVYIETNHHQIVVECLWQIHLTYNLYCIFLLYLFQN